MSLGKKKNIDNAEWIKAMSEIESAVSKKDIQKLKSKTLDEIKRITKQKKVAFAWSGGKDSIVLADICKSAGIENSMFGHTDLEYPEFLKWCLDNKPNECEVINVGLDLEWLSKHPGMLFPNDCKTVYRWYQLVQQTAIKKYFKEHELDMVVVGHRKADGNYVGKGTNISSNGAGIVRYSPLSEWSHEQVLAYIHYYELALPPIYEWENGYKCGTHPWPARTHTQNIEDGFKAVYAIDKTIVEQAAAYIPEARHFLEKGGDEK